MGLQARKQSTHMLNSLLTVSGSLRSYQDATNSEPTPALAGFANSVPPKTPVSPQSFQRTAQAPNGNAVATTYKQDAAISLLGRLAAIATVAC